MSQDMVLLTAARIAVPDLTKRVERGHVLQHAGHGGHEGALGVVPCGDDAASRSGGLMQQYLVDDNHAERFGFEPDQVLRVTHAEFGVGHTLFYRSRTGNLNGF